MDQVDQLFIDAANVFGRDTLFIHDCIKQIMQQHGLDYKDKNLQSAFIKLAISIHNHDKNDNLGQTEVSETQKSL